MPSRLSSLLDLKALDTSAIDELFSLARSLKAQARQPRGLGETVALVFFEASTRTRLSFETACVRAGLGPLVFEGGTHTSLAKGESIEDTVENIAAMMPRALVIRCGDAVNLPQLAKKISVPVINAGWGVQGHPTQALLDAFTMHESWGSLQGKRLLIVGDLKHSRVASSHVELLNRLGAEVGQVGPSDFLSTQAGLRTFSSLAEGLKWTDAVMALRFQFERHGSELSLSKADYRAHYGLNLESVKKLKAKGLILHPGPIHHGMELESEILSDPRCKVLDQVRHGVFIREALLRMILGEQA